MQLKYSYLKSKFILKPQETNIWNLNKKNKKNMTYFGLYLWF